jgi:hypothetical protein
LSTENGCKVGKDLCTIKYFAGGGKIMEWKKGERCHPPTSRNLEIAE